MEQGPQSGEAAPSSLKSKVLQLIQAIRNLAGYLASQPGDAYLGDYDDGHGGGEKVFVVPLSRELLRMADRYRASKTEIKDPMEQGPQPGDAYLGDYDDGHGGGEKVFVVPLSRELLRMTNEYHASKQKQK